MHVKRSLQDIIIERINNSEKAIIIYGARQVGKTTLVNDVIKSIKLNALTINADELKYNEVLSSRDSKKLSELTAGYELLFIDEGQRINDIGINLKIIIDNNPKLKVIVTGSSSLDLSNKISEPLTGRKWTFKLFPVSFLELKNHFNEFELKEQLEERLIYGSYPEILNLKGYEIKEAYLKELSADYLFKDILILSNIKHSNKLYDLLRLLSFQIGQLVSLNELAASLGISKETVAHYIELLEKTFVIFKVEGFSRNRRNEITKMNKYYFYDLGIRNILIQNLHPFKLRNDTGNLWENFLIIERMKSNIYKNYNVNYYFWRLYSGAEIDCVEEIEGNLYGYEFKYNNKKTSAPKSWLKEYENSEWKLINKENWLSFIL